MHSQSWFCALTVLALTACSGDDGAASMATGSTAASSSSSSSTATTNGTASASSSATSGGGASAVTEATDAYEFKYSYPGEAGRIPALAALLNAERDAGLAGLKQQSRDEQRDAAANNYDFRPHYLSVEWKRVADIPGWLSLSGDIATYGGGAHGMVSFSSILWDKAANRRRTVADLFTSPAALGDAIRAPFCRALDDQRGARRGAPVDASSGDQFDQCIDPAAQTILFGSAGRRALDRMTVMVAPYDAGPYAEGTYEIDLPVTRAVIAALRPEFRDAFAVGPGASAD